MFTKSSSPCNASIHARRSPAGSFKRVVPLLVPFGLLFFGTTVEARAQNNLLGVVLTPTPTLLNVGSTQTWQVDITNTSAAVLFINGLDDGVDTPLVLDDTTFQNAILNGLSVDPNQKVRELFTITAPKGAAGLPGTGQQATFQGYLTLTGGTSDSATDTLAMASFVVHVAGVPEGSTLLTAGLMFVTGGILLQRKGR
jgi:hypothetical protein